MLIQEYFNNKSIQWHKAGENNVSKGWININCHFCNDPSWHCGINLKSGLYHCWNCGSKGDVKDIVYRFEKSWQKTNKIRSEIQFYGNKNDTECKTQEKLNMPKFTSQTPLKVHLNYLKKRRFDPEEVIDKYDLWFGGLVGKYRHSIIIPVYSNGIPVCFVATDCTRKRYKYKKSPEMINVENHSEVLYNFDTNKKKVTIVEGIFDAWRISGTALLTKNISAKQLLKLKGKEVDIFLDPDAWKEAGKIAGMIFWTVPNLILSDRDPADL
jgi:hypothetical protein